MFHRSLSVFSRQLFLKLQVVMTLAAISVLAWSFLGDPGRATAQATPSRIAVIDVQKILSQSVIGKASYNRLKQMQDERYAKAKQMETEIVNLETEARKPTVSAVQRNTLANQISDKRIALKRYAQDADSEVGSARNRELGGLEARLKPIVDALGKEMAVAAIFNRTESGLVYAHDAIDISDAVIKRFDSGPAVPPRD